MVDTRPTLAAFLAWPETDPPREYVDGVIVQKPPLVERELWLRADLTTLLFGWARASHAGAVAAGVRCTFDARSWVIDVAYFAPGRVPAAHGGGNQVAPPDLAIEVCPSSVDPAWIGGKLAHCVAHGARLGWLVDPTEETVTVYRPGASPTVLRRGMMLEGEDVLPGFYLHVDDLFDALASE